MDITQEDQCFLTRENKICHLAANFYPCLEELLILYHSMPVINKLSNGGK